MYIFLLLIGNRIGRRDIHFILLCLNETLLSLYPTMVVYLNKNKWSRTENVKHEYQVESLNINKWNWHFRSNEERVKKRMCPLQPSINEIKDKSFTFLSFCSKTSVFRNFTISKKFVSDVFDQSSSNVKEWEMKFSPRISQSIKNGIIEERKKISQ